MIMNPWEQVDFELGELISAIGRITYDNAIELAEACRIYELIKPTLDPMQCDAWEIVIDLIAMKGVA